MRTGSYSNCTAKKQGTLNSTKVIQVHYANSCGEKQRAKQGEHDGMAEVQADATHIHTYCCYSPVILTLPTYLASMMCGSKLAMSFTYNINNIIIMIAWHRQDFGVHNPGNAF